MNTNKPILDLIFLSHGKDSKAFSLDYGLPDITGIEVCEKIREYEKFHKLPRVPIVLITAYFQTVELQKQCFNAGVDKILTKPIVDESIWKSLLAEAVR